MTTLTDFLLERIAEDEAVALEARRVRQSIRYVEGVAANEPDYVDGSFEVGEDLGVPAVIIGAERVLAECKAKRRIVERCRPRWVVVYSEAERAAAVERGEETMTTLASSDPCWPHDDAEATLLALAQPYAAHPDFQDEWRA